MSLFSLSPRDAGPLKVPRLVKQLTLLKMWERRRERGKREGRRGREGGRELPHRLRQ